MVVSYARFWLGSQSQSINAWWTLPHTRSDLRNSVKDIAVNRSRVGIDEKVRIAWLALRENDMLWTVLCGVYWTTSAVADNT